MAKKKEPEQTDSTLVEAAKAIGKAVGTVAAAVGVTADKKPAKVKIPKLAKKDKSRLPRRQKKALRKSQAPKAV